MELDDYKGEDFYATPEEVESMALAEEDTSNLMSYDSVQSSIGSTRKNYESVMALPHDQRIIELSKFK